MNTVVGILVPLFMLGVSGYQILFPEKMAQRKGRFEWRPQWQEKMVRRRGYAQYVRVIGVVVFLVAAVFLVNNLFALGGNAFLPSR